MATPKPVILLVDDNKNLLVSVGDFLEFHGYEVIQATSAEIALKKVEEREPDLVVLDISMPGMGGMGFLKRVADDNGKPRFPVLVFTARSTMESFFDSLDVDGFLAKTANEDELLDRVKTILATRRKAARPATAKLLVFLIEDQGEEATVISRAIMAEGLEVDIAFSGTEALKRIPEKQPAAVLLKDNLPQMRGSAVAALLHVMPRTQHIPIILYDAGRNTIETARPKDGIARILQGNQPPAMIMALREALKLNG